MKINIKISCKTKNIRKKNHKYLKYIGHQISMETIRRKISRQKYLFFSVIFNKQFYLKYFFQNTPKSPNLDQIISYDFM